MKTFLNLISAVLLALTSSLGFAADASTDRPHIAKVTVAGQNATAFALTNQRVKIGETEFAIARHTYKDSNELAIHLKMVNCRNTSPTEHVEVLTALKIKQLEKDEIVVALLQAKTAPATNPKPATKPETAK